MPQPTGPKNRPDQPRENRPSNFFGRQPILAYIGLTLALMLLVLFAEKGAELFRASIIQAPKFDGTVLPIKQAPDWLSTGGKNDRTYSSYTANELLPLPKYDGKQLESRCNDDYGHSYTNPCLTYPVVYMGTYKLDHKEFAGSHLAIDIRVPIGTPVYAIANGVVEVAEAKNTGFGKYIVVRHDNVPLVGGGIDTLYSGYAHMSDIEVDEYQIVEKGDLIGYSGNTGTSTTPHLHFQLDRSRAPYHPWWPFSSAQAYGANLNFFDGINEGLGQAEAIKNTVNPMEWVQTHLDYSGDGETTDPTAIPDADSSNIAKVDRFDLRPDKDTYAAGDTMNLTIVAFDEDDDIIRKYSGDNAKFSAADDRLVLPGIDFKNGKAEVEVTFQEAGEYTFSIRDGSAVKALRIIVDASDAQATPASTPDVDVPETIEDENLPVDVRLEADENFIFVRDNVTIEVTALNADGSILQHPSFENDLVVSLAGVGSVSPAKIKDRYFKNGVAKLEFSAGREAGEAVIALEGYPDDSIDFQVVAQAEPVSRFEIETDGRFAIGKKEIVTIKTIDNKGNITPSSFIGTATVTLESGSAKLEQEKLTSDDFTNGVATLSFIPLSEDSIQLKIKSGVLVGESKFARHGEQRGALFSDISEDNPNYDAIADLKEKNILSGNPDGTFRPESGINRAEFAKVILLALGIDPDSAAGNRFADVAANQWFASFVETAAKQGIIEGYPDGSFGPANNINRAELFTMFYRAVQEEVSSGASSFADVPSDAWFAEAAKYARSRNLLDFGSTFDPAKIMTRAEVAEAVSRFLNL